MIRYMSHTARAGGAVIVAAFAGACGGTAVDSVREGPSGGGGGASGSAGSSPCDSERAPPSFAVEPACSTFVPASGPYPPMTLVDRVAVQEGAKLWFEHRFRAGADSFQCGFDVVARLDGLTFGAIGDKFDGSVWWVEGIDPLNVLTLVLRSGTELRLALATPENTRLLLNLDPYDVTVESGSCSADSVMKPALLKDGTAIPCSPDPVDPTLERCELDGAAFRMVSHFVPPSADPSVIVGDATLLQPAK